MYHVLNTEPLIPSILNKDNNDRTSGCGLVVFSWAFLAGVDTRGGDIRPPEILRQKMFPI